MSTTKTEMKKTQTNDDNIPINFEEVTKAYENLLSVVESMKVDYTNFCTNRNKSAGVRLRGSLLASKKICDFTRKEILTVVKSIPIKHRAPKVEEKSSEDLIPLEKTSEDQEEKTEESENLDEKIIKKAGEVIASKK